MMAFICSFCRAASCSCRRLTTHSLRLSSLFQESLVPVMTLIDAWLECLKLREIAEDILTQML